ncbi:MAG TPA: TaqI-like C-terminal specificity domain-containing protein [Nostocaceae cyanobacterium]|nr:TaqI-like C-terminal specificity domain-containing protein [Nostocaceae cyanobacterium]
MPARLLQLDDLCTITSPEKIAVLFKRLGYNTAVESVDVADLELPSRSAEAIYHSYLIANQSNELQVLLFHLKDNEWTSPSVASGRMKSIANSICQRPNKFLLLGTKDYNQLMLVNPRKIFDQDSMTTKFGIRKLLIDRTNPTNYDRDRLEAISAYNKTPQELYTAQYEAFDVDRLTKGFYRGYKELFERVQTVIRHYNNHPYFTDPSRLHQFSQRLLGRVMFLYFLQKKEFLAGDNQFLTRQYKQLRLDPEDTDYYAQLLEPLFFDTLNKERENFTSEWGSIPYLNGGLFDRDYGQDIKDAAGRETPAYIELPNSLFDPSGENSILGFFNSYNFTVAENVAGDEDVAVDPEMLGKVFENMLAAEERGHSGTFYTPRGIVQFMCVEVLSRYLADFTGMSVEAIRNLIELDPDLPESELRQLLSKEQTKKLKQALKEVKILDPAVGSGAFPLGMMQVIVALRQVIARREGEPIRRGSLAMSRLKRDIIAKNLYGVDIKPEAIEIAKLRMWLSLVVDIPDIEDVEPLPNLDYKLMCGDSLISTINGERLIPDPTKEQQLMLTVTPIQMAIQPLLELQRRYFDAQTEERHELRSQILQAEANVFRTAVNDRRQYWEGKQRDLELQIKALKGKVSKAQEKKRGEIGSKLMELDRFAADVESGERSLNFFQYHLHFNDVFKDKGGFDVVIGNPPYVRQEAIKELKPALQKEYDCYTGVADLYVYFYEQGLRLLKAKGCLGYISSNKWFKANYGSNLRKHLATNSQIHSITDFGELPVFDAATFPMIFIAQNNKVKEQSVLFTQVKSLEEPYPNVFTIVKEQGQVLPETSIHEDNWKLTDTKSITFINKIEIATTALFKYVEHQIYRGVTTGLNKAFIIDENTKNKLINADSNSVKIIKPLVVGDDIRKWHIRDKNRWLIFARRGIDINDYPAIRSYLSQWREDLEPKKTLNQIKGRKPGNYNWYEIQDNTAYYPFFESSKIVFPDIAKEPRFTIDNKNVYIEATAFILPTKSLYILGILNSSIIWKYLTHNAAVLGDPEKGGRLRLKRIYVEKIPIPTAPEADRLAIETLVQKCLDAKDQSVEEWEAEIDDRVAHLYGLTAEEMKIIQNN